MPAVEVLIHGAATPTGNAGWMQEHAWWRNYTTAAPISLGSSIYRLSNNIVVTVKATPADNEGFTSTNCI